jgi:hypothetical protein
MSGRRLIRKGREQPEQTCDQGHQQGDLQRDGPGLRVDADDLVLDRLGLTRKLLLERGVAHHLGVLVKGLGDLLLVVGGRTVLASVIAVNVKASVAIIRPPASARPNDRPNEPPAELTPQPREMRSSEIGASV